MTQNDGLLQGQRSSPEGRPALTVLLVEDHAAVARLIQEFLPDHNRFLVTWVQTLTAALAHLRAASVDLVLLDLGLPDSWGLETVTRVVRAHPTLPVLVLSAQDDRLAYAALTAGAEGYLSKGTLEPETLVRAIQEAYERKQGMTPGTAGLPRGTGAWCPEVPG